MKTIQKVLAILVIAVCTFAIMPDNMCFADVTSVISGINVQEPNSTNSGALSNAIGKLLGFLQIASGLVAVLMIAIVGFNYIVSTPEVKDEMKKKMLPIIIGLVLVFSATSIAKFVIGVTA